MATISLLAPIGILWGATLGIPGAPDPPIR